MALPTVGPYGSLVLDDFNRAGTTSPPSASWTTGFNSADAGLQLSGDSATVMSTGSSAFVDGYWNSSTFGPDCEGWLVETTLATGTDELFALYIRGTSPGATPSAYEVNIIANALTSAVVQTEKAGVFATVGTITLSASFAVNDGLALAAFGTGSSITLEVWFWDDSAGTGWVKAGTLTDSTPTAPLKLAGNIALELQNTTSRVTLVGGGNPVPAGKIWTPHRMPLGV